MLATGLCSDKQLLTTCAIMHMLVTRDNHKSIKMRPTNVDLESLNSPVFNSISFPEVKYALSL